MTRLDKYLLNNKLVATRSQGESYVRMGKVTVNGQIVTKPGYEVREQDKVKITEQNRYVSRAGHKLASVGELFRLDFNNKVVLDVGSSTGGFTDYSLQHGAKKVYAVDVGTNQLHPSLKNNDRIELHEKTDIRNVRLAEHLSKDGPWKQVKDGVVVIHDVPDIVVIDVSFISLREILPAVKKLCSVNTKIVAMVKPQFEAGAHAKHKGVIKNDRMRRTILKQFEQWVSGQLIVIDKADSKVSGAKGNTERFYVLKIAG